jgi:YVTN family beta-propeller protein
VGRDPGDIAFHPDGQRAFVTHVLGVDVGVVDVATGTMTTTIPTGPNPFRVLVSPNGSLVYVTNATGELMVFDATTFALVNTVFSGSVANGMAMNAPGSLIYVSSAGAGLVTEHNANGTVTGRVFALGGVPQDVWFAPTGDLWVANEVGRIDVIRPSTGQVVTVALPCGAFGLRGVNAGKHVVVTCPATGQVLIVRRSDGRLMQTITVGGTPRRVAQHAGTQTIIIPNEGNWVDFIR